MATTLKTLDDGALSTKTVLDPYKASINNHMDKLGDFLFAPEPNTNNLTDYIDTWNELGAHLDDPRKTPKLLIMTT